LRFCGVFFYFDKQVDSGLRKRRDEISTRGGGNERLSSAAPSDGEKKKKIRKKSRWSWGGDIHSRSLSPCSVFALSVRSDSQVLIRSNQRCAFRNSESRRRQRKHAAKDPTPTKKRRGSDSVHSSDRASEEAPTPLHIACRHEHPPFSRRKPLRHLRDVKAYRIPQRARDADINENE